MLSRTSQLWEPIKIFFSLRLFELGLWTLQQRILTNIILSFQFECFPYVFHLMTLTIFKSPQNVSCTSLYAVHQDTAYKPREKELEKPVFVLRDIRMDMKGGGGKNVI